MKKFLVIYYAPQSANEKMASATPEEMAAGMKPWMDWKDRVGSSMVDMGTPLGNAMNVRANDVVPGKADVTGWSMIEAESMEEATELLKGHPHVQWSEGCSVEAYECMPLPGM